MRIIFSNHHVCSSTQPLGKKERPAGKNVVESKDLVYQDIADQKVCAVKEIIGTKAMDVMEPLEA